MKKRSKRLGGMMIEYVVIAAIVVGAIFVIVNFLMNKAKAKAEAVGTAMDGAVYTPDPPAQQQ